jgi:hypothetical protein
MNPYGLRSNRYVVAAAVVLLVTITCIAVLMNGGNKAKVNHRDSASEEGKEN